MKKYYTLIIILLLCMHTVVYSQKDVGLPYYLMEYSSVYAKEPKKAALDWFKKAGFGMFVHFSPASQLSGGTEEWTCLDAWFNTETKFDKMSRYERRQHLLDKMTKVSPRVEQLIRSFKPDNFNADSIADLAVSAGMKYITFTTQHVVGKMYMFDTSLSQWNSKRLLNRDFVKELSVACEKRGLGLFLYVTPPNDYLQSELRVMLKELLTNYGAIAGIWFDGIGECYRRPNDFLETGKLYAYIKQLQPQCLVSFKTGFTGDEDFLAPEWTQVKFDKNNLPLFTINVPTNEGESIYKEKKERLVLRIEEGEMVYKKQCFHTVWEKELSKKPIELCTTMLKKEQWFDMKDGEHKTKQEVLEEYHYTQKHQVNYLLNIALRGDGSIHPSDYQVLNGLNIK